MAMVLGAANRVPIVNFAQSDFGYVNECLASHNGLEPVTGSALRRVALPKRSSCGGLLTQGPVLKITANGSSTSPVLRGSWVMDRITGDPPPLRLRRRVCRPWSRTFAAPGRFANCWPCISRLKCVRRAMPSLISLALRSRTSTSRAVDHFLVFRNQASVRRKREASTNAPLGLRPTHRVR